MQRDLELAYYSDQLQTRPMNGHIRAQLALLLTNQVREFFIGLMLKFVVTPHSL